MSAAVRVTTSALDEARHSDGRARPLYESLLASLEASDLAAIAADVDASLVEEGVTFGEIPFRVDPVPRLIDAAEWSSVERGLEQRMRALVAFVADAHGARDAVAAGVIPARVIESAAGYERDAEGIESRAAGWVGGFDLVRGDDGVLRVLEDNMRTPSGIAYLAAARVALAAHLPSEPPPGLRDPSPAFDLLGAALRAAAPAGVDAPAIVVLSDGPSNNAWYEHRQIARRLGLPLVLPGDLSHRGDRLLARVDAREIEVDVVYRRTDVDGLRDPEGVPTWVSEALLGPVCAGTLAVVNPFGGGVADDKLVHAYAEDLVRFYLGEEPAIESVPTYDLGDDDIRALQLARLDELVVKPRHGLGGQGVVICPHASSEDRERVAELVVAQPDSWVAQEMVALSTHPTVIDGRLAPRHVDLRPFVIGGGDTANVVPGGLTRFALREGELVVNSSQEGGGKDTWVLA